MTYKQKVFILQLGIAFFFGWFGIEKLISPELWISALPQWFTSYTKFHLTQTVLFLGACECVIALWLLLPWKTHWAASLAFIYMLGVVSCTGITHAGVRDISIMIASFALIQFAIPPKIDLHFSR